MKVRKFHKSYALLEGAKDEENLEITSIFKIYVCKIHGFYRERKEWEIEIHFVYYSPFFLNATYPGTLKITFSKLLGH